MKFVSKQKANTRANKARDGAGAASSGLRRQAVPFSGRQVVVMQLPKASWLADPAKGAVNGAAERECQ
jgi:hypothetical protein